MDLIFYDLKLMDDTFHQCFTGVSNERIKENLKAVGRLRTPLIVRIPTIVGVNAFAENIHAVCSFLQKYVPTAKLEFLPYHRLGTDKYKELGLMTPDEQYEVIRNSKLQEMDFPFADSMRIPSQELLDSFTAIAKTYQIETVSFR